MDIRRQRHAPAQYAFLAAITELVMMELERDAWKDPFQPGTEPTLKCRCSLCPC